MVKNKRTRIFDLIISFIIAVAAWGYVINVVNPPTVATVKAVPVKVMGTEILTYKKLAVAGQPEYTVDVDIQGPRSELIGVGASDIKATVDFSTLTAGQNYVSVNVEGPSGLTIAEVRSQKLAVYVEELVTVNKPLNIVCNSTVSGYEPTILRYESDMVAVSGAKSLVEMISEVRVNLDVTTLAIDSPKTQSLEAIPLDSEGNIVTGVTLPNETVSVTASLYPIKTVPLELAVEGKPAYNAQVRYTDYPQTIIIKGPSSRLSSVDKISAGTVNINGITQTASFDLTPQLPTGVYLSDQNTEFKATVGLVDSGSVTFEYAFEQVRFTGLSENVTIAAITGSSVSIKATSTIAVIKTLTAENVAPMLDFSSLEPGFYSLPIESIYKKGDVGFEFVPSYIDVVLVPSDPDAPMPDEGYGGEPDLPAEEPPKD